VTALGVPGFSLILLPGLDGTGEFFQPLLEAIGDSIPTQVIRYPVRGGYDYDTCLKLVQAELPTDRRYVVLGESFSGPIAIVLGALAPRGLSGVILSSSFASNPRPRLSIIRPLLPYLPFHGSGASVRLSRFMVLGRWITPPIRELHQRILAKVPPETLRRRLESVADCNVCGKLAQVRVPILCLVPKHDRLVPKSAAKVIQHHAATARVVEIAAPHCLLQCEPGKAVVEIRAFMQSLP
jgi:pimeloyl-[acyl-carrier protein] methyl ester esterase